MTREAVKKELRDILRLTFVNEKDEPIEYKDDELIVSDERCISSIDLVMIIVEIEERFNIEVDDEYLIMDFITTINSMTDLVCRMLSEQRHKS